MNRMQIRSQDLKDSDNFEGLMANSSDTFQLLIKNKAVASFARAEAKTRPIKLDSLLTKLYLAL